MSAMSQDACAPSLTRHHGKRKKRRRRMWFVTKMNNLPSRLEKYDKEGWYRYLHRAMTLKNAPNADLDMNVFTKCIVGRCRQGAIYFSRERVPETYCKGCKDYSKTIFKVYNMISSGGGVDDEDTDTKMWAFTLDTFFDHLERDTHR